MKRFSILFITLLIVYSHTLAQDIDSLAQVPQKEYVTAAFKSTRVINAHSMEMLGKGTLDVRILHRFGLINEGIDEMFGLDHATMRLGFDYGITNNLMAGIGRSTFRKEIDAFVKARLLRQSTGTRSTPLSLLITAGGMIRTEKYFIGPRPSTTDRLSWYAQLIAGRKFTSAFSLQFSPIILFTNMPYNAAGDKLLFAPGIGARFKLSRRVAFTVDYHHPVNNMDSIYTSPLSMGFDIETGGHVFQLHFSNSAGMNERAYLTETTGRFFEGDIRFGFNLSRIFQVGKRR